MPGGGGGFAQRGGRHDQALRRERRRGGESPASWCGADRPMRRSSRAPRRRWPAPGPGTNAYGSRTGGGMRDRLPPASRPGCSRPGPPRAARARPPTRKGSRQARRQQIPGRAPAGRPGFRASSRLTTISPAPAAASCSTAAARAARGGGQAPSSATAASSARTSTTSPLGASGPRRRKRQSSVWSSRGPSTSPSPYRASIAKTTKVTIRAVSSPPAGPGRRSPVAAPSQSVVRAMASWRRAAPQIAGALGGAPGATSVPSPGRSTTAPPARARTVTSPTIDSTPVPLAVLSTSHSVERTEATAVRVSISIERPPSTSAADQARDALQQAEHHPDAARLVGDEAAHGHLGAGADRDLQPVGAADQCARIGAGAQDVVDEHVVARGQGHDCAPAYRSQAALGPRDPADAVGGNASPGREKGQAAAGPGQGGTT